MKRTGIVFALMLAACGSSPKAAPEPSTVPPPQLVPLPSQSLEQRVDDLQTSMTELLDRLDVIDARLSRLESRVPVAAAPPPPQAAAPEMPPNAAPTADVPEAYRQALILYGQGKQAEARAAFQKVLDADPGGQLANNALFWIGETWYAVGEYNTAIGFYQRVVREYPRQNKAPDALFKMAMAYVKTGDLGMARRTFQQCIAQYPYSPPASSSKRELQRIRY